MLTISSISIGHQKGLDWLIDSCGSPAAPHTTARWQCFSCAAAQRTIRGVGREPGAETRSSCTVSSKRAAEPEGPRSRQLSPRRSGESGCVPDSMMVPLPHHLTLPCMFTCLTSRPPPHTAAAETTWNWTDSKWSQMALKPGRIVLKPRRVTVKQGYLASSDIISWRNITFFHFKSFCRTFCAELCACVMLQKGCAPACAVTWVPLTCLQLPDSLWYSFLLTNSFTVIHHHIGTPENHQNINSHWSRAEQSTLQTNSETWSHKKGPLCHCGQTSHPFTHVDVFSERPHLHQRPSRKDCNMTEVQNLRTGRDLFVFIYLLDVSPGV